MCRYGGVRIDRVVLGDSEAAAVLDFHPRLTIVAGLDREAHRTLARSVLTSLGVAESGTHAEFTDADGRRRVAFRGDDGTQIVVSSDTGDDVTADYVDESGRIDVLRSVGYLSRREAERYCVLDAAELASRSEEDLLVDALARLDQDELWGLLDELDEAEAAVRVQADAAGPAGLDDEMAEIVESRRNDRLRCEDNMFRWRWAASTVAPTTLLASYVATHIGFALAALPLLGVALVAVLGAFDAQRRHAHAMELEQRVLLKAEADTYADYQINRGNGLLAGDDQRRAYMDATEHHRIVAERWSAVFGDITPTWVRRRRRDIEAVARLYDVAETGDGSAATSTRSEIASLPLSTAVLRWMQSSSIGRTTLPAILCEPFDEIPPELKPTLLESLTRSTEQRQTVLITNDADVVAWAELEALTGTLSLVNVTATSGSIEPAPAMFDEAQFEDRVRALRVLHSPDVLVN